MSWTVRLKSVRFWGLEPQAALVMLSSRLLSVLAIGTCALAYSVPRGPKPRERYGSCSLGRTVTDASNLSILAWLLLPNIDLPCTALGARRLAKRLAALHGLPEGSSLSFLNRCNSGTIWMSVKPLFKGSNPKIKTPPVWFQLDSQRKDDHWFPRLS
jgi:hypothetical protein